jgi:hypothetical protein
MSLEKVIFKGQGRVAFGKEALKNELFLHIKVLGNDQKKNAIIFAIIF